MGLSGNNRSEEAIRSSDHRFAQETVQILTISSVICHLLKS